MQTSMYGYIKKPSWIYLIAAVYISLPFLNLVQQWSLLGFPHLSELNITKSYFLGQDILYYFAAGFLVLWVTKLSLVLFICFSAYNIGFRLVTSGFDLSSVSSLDAMVMFFSISAALTLLASPIRLAYMKPETRWWRRMPRYPVMNRGILFFKGVKYPIVIMNLSSGGAFIKLDERIFQQSLHGGTEDRRRQIATGRALVKPEELLIARKNVEDFPTEKHQLVKLTISTIPSLDNPFKGFVFESKATVVWATKETDVFHYGLGIKFIWQSYSDKRHLRKYVSLLNSISKKSEQIPVQ